MSEDRLCFNGNQMQSDLMCFQFTSSEKPANSVWLIYFAGHQMRLIRSAMNLLCRQVDRVN